MKRVEIILLFAITLAGCIGTETIKTKGNPESKNKIKAKISRETNYVYHMLPVAKCGYDNEYGNNYALYPSSGRVMQKCGMIFEGRIRGRSLFAGEICDCLQYSILKSDIN
jgi:hypothetical protein